MDLNHLPQITVGHFTNRQKGTGCTVFLCEEGIVAGVSSIGPILGSQEIELARYNEVIEKVHAVVLSGRSSYGLAAIAGVIDFLEERKSRLTSLTAKVGSPIVTAASIFDISNTGTREGLDSAAGYQACLSATADQFSQHGALGVGTAARVGKIFGPEYACSSGVGSAMEDMTDFRIGVLVVINAFGRVYSLDHCLLAGPRHFRSGNFITPSDAPPCEAVVPAPGENTTIAVFLTDLALTKWQANQSAEDALKGWTGIVEPFSSKTDSFLTYVLATGEAKTQTTVRAEQEPVAQFKREARRLLAKAAQTIFA